MSNKYDFASVEPKWQKYWEEHGSFRASEDPHQAEVLRTVEFPYPSGHGCMSDTSRHIPVWKLSAGNAACRATTCCFLSASDAYGLPTENTAIKTGVHPRKVTDDNIVKFTGQLKRVGFSFDWSRSDRYH